MSANYPPEIAEKIEAQFPDAVQDTITFRGEVTLVIDPERIVEVATYCRDTKGLAFNMLFDLAGIDYWPEQPRFAVAYTLFSLMHNHFVRLKVYTPGSKPILPTMIGVWPAAQWPEREVYDLFGIRFEGHPDVRRILLPYDWTGHPLRKDYPLGFEEVQFSFNFDRVQSKKPHPKE